MRMRDLGWGLRCKMGYSVEGFVFSFVRLGLRVMGSCEGLSDLLLEDARGRVGFVSLFNFGYIPWIVFCLLYIAVCTCA